jgi:hypothetical protein
MRRIQLFNQQLKILNIGWDMRGFVYRFVGFCCICMGLYTSTTNNTMNISSILTRVGSLDSSHWDLFNSLFNNYIIPNIHGDIVYRMCSMRLYTSSLQSSTSSLILVQF